MEEKIENNINFIDFSQDQWIKPIITIRESKGTYYAKEYMTKIVIRGETKDIALQNLQLALLSHTEMLLTIAKEEEKRHELTNEFFKKSSKT